MTSPSERALSASATCNVVITGAGTGIGEATALLYAQQGAGLVLAGRRASPLESVADRCRDAGARDVLVVPTDVTDAAACEALVDAAVDRLGSVDVCVHAAAVAAYGRVEDMPLEALDRVVETNLLGTVRLVRPVLGQMRRQERGSLVVLGSVLGQVAVPEMGAYVVSKWAVRGLVRVLTLETRDVPDVHVSSVAPGGVDTPIYARAGNWTGREPRPPWPVASPESVAQVVVRAADNPRRERLTGWASPLMVVGSALAPRVYDVLVGPLMRRIGFTGKPAADGPGDLWLDDPLSPRGPSPHPPS